MAFYGLLTLAVQLNVLAVRPVKPDRTMLAHRLHISLFDQIFISLEKAAKSRDRSQTND